MVHGRRFGRTRTYPIYVKNNDEISFNDSQANAHRRRGKQENQYVGSLSELGRNLITLLVGCRSVHAKKGFAVRHQVLLNEIQHLG